MQTPATPNIPTPAETAEQTGPELSLRALLLGLLLAAILGAANAYLGLKAGMTVAATFPAAVIAIAAFRLPFMRGGVLEQNIARTTATVGEALVAAAIFTLPAFVIARVDGEPVWATFNLWQSIAILGLGGILGLLFIIVMRRTLTVDSHLPFPESYACYEIVRAGQRGAADAKYVFGAMGGGMLLELFKNTAGIPLITATKTAILSFVGKHGLALQTPLASPAIIGVGFIIGPRYATLAFTGGLMAWVVLIPILMGLNIDPTIAQDPLIDATKHLWKHHVRTMAIGAMFMASFYTLWGLRQSITSAFQRAFRRTHPQEAVERHCRTEHDLNIKGCFIVAFLLALPMAVVFYHYTHSMVVALVGLVLLLVLGFFLAVIGGWLCGLVGSSNQPVSGITLTALIIMALVLFLLKTAGSAGVAAALTFAVVICSAAALSGTLIQELKVGHLLGATPWKMELAQILGTIVVAFFAVYPMVLLHESTIATNLAAGLPPIGIGGEALPAPQAGLMAHVATAILGGSIDWTLMLIGMGIGALIILCRIPGPMVVAVGMYLSFYTTAAIFLGGVLRWLLDRQLAKRPASGTARIDAQNRGILLASGFIAGEALTGVVLAGVVMLFLKMATANPSAWGALGQHLSLSALFSPTWIAAFAEQFGGWCSLVLFALVAWTLLAIPLRRR
ncbi:MAG: oligopeptide transporter, OPT family [Deltaproteobacteria bacterium]|nr:oligopeptide transporter, OPT family [Deltaproteobacteria bacterium]